MGNFVENPAYEDDPTQPPLICDMGGDGVMTGFHGMFMTLLVGNIVLPFLTIPLTWVFIPNKRLDEDFLEEDGPEVELTKASHGQEMQPGMSFNAASVGTTGQSSDVRDVRIAKCASILTPLRT